MKNNNNLSYLMVSDSTGNIYSDDWTIFQKAHNGITAITLDSQTKYIYGSSSSDYAFINYSSTHQNVYFENCINLLEINQYAYYSCYKYVEYYPFLCNKKES